MSVDVLLQKKYISKSSIDPSFIKLEIDEGSNDLKKAQESFAQKDFSWSIVKSYMSMFHLARAMLYRDGFKEKSHSGLHMYLEHLSVIGTIEPSFAKNFKIAMLYREEAEYQSKFSEAKAKESLSIAKDFSNFIKYLK